MDRKSFASLIIGILFIFSIAWTLLSLSKILATIAPDFNVLWLASKDLIVGNNPYLNPDIFTGVGYPANTLLFYIPFTFFNYHVAQAIFTLLSLAAIIYSIFLSFKILVNKVPLEYFLLAIALALISFPTKFTLGMGQNNAIALLILLISYFLYKREKSILAGIFLGIAISFKTIFIFFLLYYFLQKRWKLLLYTFITVGVFVIATALIPNYGWYDYYLTKALPPLFELSGREIYYNQGIMGFVSRITTNLELRKYLNLFLSLILIAIPSYYALKSRNKNLTFSIFLVTLPLVDTLSWQHHFVWLIFPFIIIAYYLSKAKSNYLWILLGVSYLLISWNFKNPSIYLEFPEILLLSNQFYGALILWGLNLFLLVKPD